MTMEKLAVIGGGAWGTALAQVAASGGRETLLWAIEDDVVTWDDFREANFPKVVPIGPFTFRRAAYEAAIAAL